MMSGSVGIVGIAVAQVEDAIFFPFGGFLKLFLNGSSMHSDSDTDLLSTEAWVLFFVI